MKTPTSCKGYIKGEERYCSPACRDAAIPPLSAQGDGPKCRVCSDRHIAPLCNGKCFECFRTKITGPAPAAKHAESVADTRPKCGNNGCKTPYQGVALRACITMDDDGVKNGVAMERSCDPCHLLDEAEFAHNTSVTIATTGTSDVLHNDKVPERLSKPRLSHVAGIHDDDLLAGEGCAR